MKKRWYEEGISFTCVRCGVCCHDHGEYGFVFLFEGEPELIASSLGMDLRSFQDECCVSVGGCLCISNNGPACLFFEEGRGCAIYEARPLQCRCWPFWPENLDRKEWVRGVEKWCPGASGGELHTMSGIEKIAGMMKSAKPLQAPACVRKA